MSAVVDALRWALDQVGLEGVVAGVSLVSVLLLLSMVVWMRRARRYGGVATAKAGTAAWALQVVALGLVGLTVLGIASINWQRAHQLGMNVGGWLLEQGPDVVQQLARWLG